MSDQLFHQVTMYGVIEQKSTWRSRLSENFTSIFAGVRYCFIYENQALKWVHEMRCSTSCIPQLGKTRQTDICPGLFES